jgi:uncharacterized OsmC-like protein
LGAPGGLVGPPRVDPPHEFPPVPVELVQVERYRFTVTYPGSTLGPQTVDEAPPVGAGGGPDPVQALAATLGHCLSSTLFNTLERAHVRSTPIRTTVTVTLGRNARGRKRVTGVEVRIACAPLDEADRGRFQRGVAVFEDYCTVTGSVREGVPVVAHVTPATLGSATGTGGA